MGVAETQREAGEQETPRWEGAQVPLRLGAVAESWSRGVLAIGKGDVLALSGGSRVGSGGW